MLLLLLADAATRAVDDDDAAALLRPGLRKAGGALLAQCWLDAVGFLLLELLVVVWPKKDLVVPEGRDDVLEKDGAGLGAVVVTVLGFFFATGCWVAGHSDSSSWSVVGSKSSVIRKEFVQSKDNRRTCRHLAPAAEDCCSWRRSV